jgi:hypothetical protein
MEDNMPITDKPIELPVITETIGKCPNCNSENCQAIHYDGDGGYQILCNDCKTAFWEIYEMEIPKKKSLDFPSIM